MWTENTAKRAKIQAKVHGGTEVWTENTAIRAKVQTKGLSYPQDGIFVRAKNEKSRIFCLFAGFQKGMRPEVSLNKLHKRGPKKAQ